MRKLTTITVAILAILALAIGPVAAQQNLTIGVAAIGLEHHWDITAFNSAVSKLKSMGVTVIGLDGERQTQKHIANLETLLQMKPTPSSSCWATPTSWIP